MEQRPVCEEFSCGWRKDEARPLISVIALWSPQCFDTDGWVRGRTSGLVKPLIPRGCPPEQVDEEDLRGNQVHQTKRSLNGISSTNLVNRSIVLVSVCLTSLVFRVAAGLVASFRDKWSRFLQCYMSFLSPNQRCQNTELTIAIFVECLQLIFHCTAKHVVFWNSLF